YYTWWVRHSNDDSDETNGIMEYSIVRNNIYKIDVTSVYSIGGDVPDDDLLLRVYVKKWEMYNKETIDL
ncbi:MAG: Mfa1 fimbrilin C-terminal domain-containing protein, partial [Prevotella sp.]|nr:Mfa1 fimbrilin C-terminal domain-containing protein [Prevotella sp.]